MPEYQIKIEKRTHDGRDLYSCGVHIVPLPQDCIGGCCGSYFPAYSRDEAVEKIRDTLQEIRNGGWNWEDKPTPKPENTEITDETGEFAVSDFFESTIQTFMQTGEA